MEFRFPLSSDIITMVRLFLECAQNVLRSRYSITLAQFRTLAYIEKGIALTATDLAEPLGQPIPRISVNISQLGSRGIVECRSRRGTSKELAATARGSSLFAACRDGVQEEFERLLAPLDEDQAAAFKAGCLVTAVKDGVFSYFGEAPDYVYSYLRAFYLSEQTFTETANRFGLSLSCARVLLALVEADGRREYADLRQTLLMPSATMADAVKPLCREGTVDSRPLDGRSKLLALTPQGAVLAQGCARALDDCLMDSIRSSAEAERRQYAVAAAAIVHAERAARRGAHSGR